MSHWYPRQIRFESLTFNMHEPYTDEDKLTAWGDAHGVRVNDGHIICSTAFERWEDRPEVKKIKKDKAIEYNRKRSRKYKDGWKARAQNQRRKYLEQLESNQDERNTPKKQPYTTVLFPNQ